MGKQGPRPCDGVDFTRFYSFWVVTDEAIPTMVGGAPTTTFVSFYFPMAGAVDRTVDDAAMMQVTVPELRSVPSVPVGGASAVRGEGSVCLPMGTVVATSWKHGVFPSLSSSWFQVRASPTFRSSDGKRLASSSMGFMRADVFMYSSILM